MIKCQNILLVDDDPDDRLIFIDAIKEIDSKIECHTANNGKEALDLLSRGQFSPDIIFLDLNMPFMNGFEFLKEFRNKDSFDDIPVIIFSTSASPNQKQMTKSLGADAFLTKPSGFDTLRNEVDKILQSDFCG